MAKPYHIKLKRTTKNLTDNTVQNYNDLKWGEPVFIDNADDGKYLVIGDKNTNTPDADNPDNYQSQAIKDLNVFKSVKQLIVEIYNNVNKYLTDRFTFWKTAETAPIYDTTIGYAVGDKVTYNSKLYFCKTAINSPAGQWDSTKWQLLSPQTLPSFKGTHVTLLQENLGELLPDTRSTYVAYTKKYTGGVPDWSDVSQITDAQTAINDKADLNSPNFTGTPKISGTNIATTGDINTAVNGTAPSGTNYYLAKLTGAHTVGTGPKVNTGATTSTKFLREDGTWVTPDDTRVAQEGSATNGNFPILFKANATTANETNKALYGNKANNLITANPSNGTINAVTGAFTNGSFSGSLTINSKAVATEEYVNNHMNTFEVVSTLATASASTMGKIYVKTTSATSGGVTYTEYVPYITVLIGSTYTWVPLSGTW